jgi:hypothetical protein
VEVQTLLVAASLVSCLVSAGVVWAHARGCPGVRALSAARASVVALEALLEAEAGLAERLAPVRKANAGHRGALRRRRKREEEEEEEEEEVQPAPQTPPPPGTPQPASTALDSIIMRSVMDGFS